MLELSLKNYIYLDDKEHISLLKIRNNEFIREVSLNSNEIKIEEHLLFIEKLKKSSNKYFAVFVDGKVLGGVNIFDIENEIKWGMFFDEKISLLIKAIIPVFFINYIFDSLKKDRLFLEVKTDNKNAISYNKNLGFTILKEDDKIIKMKMDKEEFNIAKQNIFLKRVIKKMDKYNINIKE